MIDRVRQKQGNFVVIEQERQVLAVRSMFGDERTLN